MLEAGPSGGKQILQTLMRKSRPREAGICSVSRLRADGVYGKRTGNMCLVSISS